MKRLTREPVETIHFFSLLIAGPWDEFWIVIDMIKRKAAINAAFLFFKLTGLINDLVESIYFCSPLVAGRWYAF